MKPRVWHSDIFRRNERVRGSQDKSYVTRISELHDHTSHSLGFFYILEEIRVCQILYKIRLRISDKPRLIAIIIIMAVSKTHEPHFIPEVMR